MQTLSCMKGFAGAKTLKFSCSQYNFCPTLVLKWSCKSSQKHRPLPLKCSNSWNILKWFMEVFRVMQVYFRTLVSWLISELWCCIFLFLFLIPVQVCGEVFHNVNVYCNTSCMNHSAEPILLSKVV